VGNLKTSLVKTSINLILLGLTASVIPSVSANETVQNGGKSGPTAISDFRQIKVTAQPSDETPSETTITMSDEQHYWLLSKMEDQAGYRRKIKKTAFLALTELQQLAIEKEFDPNKAKQLAEIYGMALAKLTLLNIQLASRLKTILSPSQRKILEDSIERRRLMNDL
jgi:hypothetical protein